MYRISCEAGRFFLLALSGQKPNAICDKRKRNIRPDFNITRAAISRSLAHFVDCGKIL